MQVHEQEEACYKGLPACMQDHVDAIKAISEGDYIPPMADGEGSHITKMPLPVPHYLRRMITFANNFAKSAQLEFERAHARELLVYAYRHAHALYELAPRQACFIDQDWMLCTLSVAKHQGPDRSRDDVLLQAADAA